MSNYIKNITQAYSTSGEEPDQGSIIQWVIISFIIVGLTVFVLNQVTPPVKEKGVHLGSELEEFETRIQP